MGVPNWPRVVRRRNVLALAGGLIAAPAIVRAQGRNGVALVIGNARYSWEASLPNVKRDAPDIATRFEQLGLRTELMQDLDGSALRAAIEKFGVAARGVPLAAFYFAGHGVYWERQSYVVPADANLASANAAKSLLAVPSIGAALKDAGARLLVFDACRNNPADGWRQREARGMARNDAMLSLAAAKQQSSTLVLFSTAPGSIALDGPAGENSPFAAALMRQLGGSSTDLTVLPQKLRRDLLLATDCRQMLWDQSTFAAPFSVAGPAAAVRGASIDPARVVELPQAYEYARQSGLLLPQGLVALRPAGRPAHPRKVGSYRYESAIRGPGGELRGPYLAIVLSLPDGNSAEIVQSFKNYEDAGGRRWRSVTGTAGTDVVSWLSIDERTLNELKWRDDNSGMATVGPANAASGSVRMRVDPFVRLDG